MDPHPQPHQPPPRYLDLLARLEQARLAGVALGLERTRAVLERLGNPQRAAVTVHIAGTNGKGSTAALTASILRAAGLRTGLYTSPHLSRFTERIRIDGVEVDGDRLAALEPRIAATGIPLTYFEIATVLAFLTFAAEGVDVVVAETGLGGRLDATTACEPVATAITSIGLDHAELLGGTLVEIAREKAGIAKGGVPLFLGPLAPEVDAEIAAVAQAAGAPVRRWGADFWLAADVAVGLAGPHQRRNAALAVALARAAVAARGGGPLEPRAITVGLRDVVWPGRLEWVGEEILLDCAHNSEGARSLAATLDGLQARRPRVLVFSTVAGKPAAEMLAILASRFDTIIVTGSSNPRALPAAELEAMYVRSVGGRAGEGRATVTPEVVAVADPVQALAAARTWLIRQRTGSRNAAGGDGDGDSRSETNGLVVVAGSSFLVGDLRALLLGELRDPIPTSDPVSSAATQRWTHTSTAKSSAGK